MEIKVRAWDNTNNRMYYSKQPEYDMSKGMISIVDTYEFTFDRYSGELILKTLQARPPIFRDGVTIHTNPQMRICDDYKLMLFTGIKDKNRIDIYVGDIISTPKGICAVTFELGCFYAITVSRYRLGGWNTESIEVLGNVHEHSELLTGRHEA